MSVPLPDSRSSARTYRFGDFELDLAAYRLTREGESVPLERRPFDLLVLLVTRNGQLVTREEIVSTLWPNNVVIDFDAGVNTLIRKVRQALGDSTDNPVFIETVPARGYRFIAAVESLTPKQAQRHPEPDPPESSSRNRYPSRAAVLATLVVALGLAGWLTTAGGQDPTSIAVLPFEDRTGDVELGYLAAGLAEEVAVSLTQIEPARLRVMGGVSAKALGESERSLSAAGRELGVDWVVRSSLHAEGSRIRVNASLVRTRDNQQIWAAAFDRELVDILGLQRELSIAIAEQVRLRLSPEVLAEVERRQTLNPRAYEHYLKGRFLWGQFTPATTREALRSYERAVQEDPEYALAWAGIAQALASAPMTTDADPATIVQAAQDSVRRAVEYGSDLAEAQYAQAYVHLFLDWDVPAAESAARRAVALDPNNALAYLFLGVVLSQARHDVEALAMMRRARELDPLFSHTFALSSMVASQTRDYRSALEFAQQAIAITPGAWVGYLHLGTAHLGLGDAAAALEAFSTARRLSGGNSKAIASLAYVHAMLGHTEQARALLGELEEQSSKRYVPPYAVAVILTGLGEIEQAFEWLDRALSARDVHVLGMDKDLRMAPLHGDPRFQRVLELCGCAPL